MSEPKKIISQTLKQFPGGTWNALVEGELRDRVPKKQLQQPAPFALPSTVLVQLIWLGSTSVPPGSVVVLTDPPREYGDDPSVPFSTLQFKCIAPTTATLDSPFAITTTPLDVLTGKKSMGWGYIPNACWAQVSINDAGDESLELANASTRLQSSSGGRVPIIWKPSGTGVKWCIVQLPLQGGIRFARVTTEISAATNQLTANWGTGAVKLQHNSTGVLAADAITVDNLNIGTAFVVDAQVQLDMGYAIPRVLNGSCAAVSWSA